MSNPPPSWDRTERRATPDRRSQGRQGKYDRRRNRCINCRHFSAGETPQATGFCQKHQEPFIPDTFACADFQNIEII